LERIEAEIGRRECEAQESMARNVALVPAAGLISEIAGTLSDDGARARIAAVMAMLLSDPDLEKAAGFLTEIAPDQACADLQVLAESEIFASFQQLVVAEPSHKDLCAAVGELLEVEIPLARCKGARFAECYEEFICRVAKAWQSQRGWYDHNGFRQGGLMAFIRYFWHVLEPETRFVDGWCLAAMAQHLEAVTAGEITRLLINIFPGGMKSLMTDVYCPHMSGGRWGWRTIAI
jgi:hypothetical protein